MRPNNSFAGRLPGIACLCLLFALPSAVPVHADSLRMVASDWPPYVSRDLPHNGAVIAMVTEALARDGHEAELRIDTWPRALEGIRLGVFDVVAGAWQDSSRDTYMAYSDPLIENEVVFVTLSERFIEYDVLDDLQGLFIGIEQDFAYSPDFLEHHNLIRVEYRNLIQNINGLQEGAIDIIVTDREAFLHAINSYLPGSRHRFRVLSKPLETRTLHLGISRRLKNHELLLDDFNNRLEQMRRDGSYTAILHRHGIKGPAGRSGRLLQRPDSTGGDQEALRP